jgi:hypothetical protein
MPSKAVKKKPARPKWLTPLKKSIDHWREVSGVVKPWDAHIGVDNCALCDAYYTDDNDDDSVNRCCVGCPIREKTGKQFCNGTPYIYAYNALYRWKWVGPSPTQIEYKREIRLREIQFRKAANRMLVFLENLVPRAFRPVGKKTAAKKAVKKAVKPAAKKKTKRG